MSGKWVSRENNSISIGLRSNSNSAQNRRSSQPRSQSLRQICPVERARWSTENEDTEKEMAFSEHLWTSAEYLSVEHPDEVIFAKNKFESDRENPEVLIKKLLNNWQASNFLSKRPL